MNSTYSWYSTLKKPSFSPPSWVFGPVWSVLYVIIAISFLRVFFLAYSGAFSWIITLPFILNLVFNFSYSPIQFRLRNNYLAAVDILLILSTLVWMIFVIWPYSHLVAYAQIPYLLWVSFATILQLTITWLNKAK